ncbi:MAG: hypothetical protein R3F61_09100 [Myxococcota bacterium]
MGILALLLAGTAAAGPVPMFGQPTATGSRPGVFFVVVVVPPVPATPESGATGAVLPSRWQLPEAPKPAWVSSEPSAWQRKRTVVEQPGAFVDVTALDAAFVPIEPARNVLAE